MRIASLGHAVFAATLVALGISSLVTGDFAVIWQPSPRALPALEAWVYISAFITLTAGLGLLWLRASALAARVLLFYLLIWLLLWRLPRVIRSPTAQESWSGAGETAVIVAAAGILYAWFAAERDQTRLGPATRENALRLARILYGLSMIPFGIAHFNYVKATAGLIPGWLPSHVAFTYFTGGAFLAAGVAIIIGVGARLAAALSALQMGLFTLLVWIPILAAGSRDAFQWSETIISWTLTAAAWVVADSYRAAHGARIIHVQS